jgi:hypothetical protein
MAVSAPILPPLPPTITSWTKETDRPTVTLWAVDDDGPTVTGWIKDPTRPRVDEWTKAEDHWLPMAA